MSEVSHEPEKEQLSLSKTAPAHISQATKERCWFTQVTYIGDAATRDARQRRIRGHGEDSKARDVLPLYMLAQHRIGVIQELLCDGPRGDELGQVLRQARLLLVVHPSVGKRDALRFLALLGLDKEWLDADG